MKKILPKAPMLCLLTCLFVPASKGIALIFGYEFILVHDNFVLAGITWILIFMIALSKQKVVLDRANTIFATMLFPVSLLNALCFIVAANWVTAVLIVLSCGFAVAICGRFGGTPILRIFSNVIASILLLLLIFMALLYGTFGRISVYEVVKTVPSPNHSYEARLINNDQGACGGATIVQVKKHKGSIHILIGEFSKAPTLVYKGGWGEFETMELTWRDEHTLLINGTAYSMTD